MSQLIYAIGDIHGALEPLRNMHARISQDAADQGVDNPLVVHVGDLVDRQADSKGVIEYLMEGQATGRNWTVLKGNHDRMMVLFVRDGIARDPCMRPDYTWLHPNIGGLDTLASYGVGNGADLDLDVLRAAAIDAIPPVHLAYLDSLPDHLDTRYVYFCHAGIVPGIPLADQTEDTLLWIRKPFHDATGPHPKLIVHGHTPVKRVTHYGNRINIDSGAAFDWGELSAIVLNGRDVMQLTPDGRAPLFVDPKVN